VLTRAAIPLADDETGGSLHDKLAALGAEKLVETVDLLASGAATATPQPEQGVTYAEKLRKDEAEIDWNLPAEVLERRIRAFNPWPSTWTTFRGKPLKIHRTLLANTDTRDNKPGEMIAAGRDGLVIATGEGALRLIDVQPAGKKSMSAEDLMNGHQVKAGEMLGSDSSL